MKKHRRKKLAKVRRREVREERAIQAEPPGESGLVGKIASADPKVFTRSGLTLLTSPEECSPA